MCRSPRRKHPAGVTLLAWAKILHLAFAGEVGGKTPIAHEKTTCRGQTSASAKKPPSCDGGGAETKSGCLVEQTFQGTNVPQEQHVRIPLALEITSLRESDSSYGMNILRLAFAMPWIPSRQIIPWIAIRRLYWASMMRSITTKLGRQTCLLLLSPKSTIDLISNKRRALKL